MLPVKENSSAWDDDVITEEKRKKKRGKSRDEQEERESEELRNFPVYTESIYAEESSKLCEKSRRATTSTDHSRAVDEPCMSMANRRRRKQYPSGQAKLHSLSSS